MGRISDIIPSLYYRKPNDLIKFVNALDVEVDLLEKQVAGITDLINVDKCPDDKLVYLAALTNCPLIGNDPVLWRRQIKNWPYLLKIKGTELSLDIFLNSIGVTVPHEVHTFFRDEAGNLAENKSDRFSIRTHMFDLDITWEDKRYISWYEWDKDFIEKFKIWMERVKPFHAELRKLTSFIPDKEQINLFAGMAQGLGGYKIINLTPPQTEHDDILYAGVIHEENKELSMEVDLDTMNELLARFENRIFERMEQQEARATARHDEDIREINAKLDEILELLRWH